MSEVMRAYGMHCNDLSPKEIAWLGAKGVHPDALGWGTKHFAVKGAFVRWEGERWFEFANEEDGKRAAVIVCLDERGDASDLAAWSPADERLGLCWGNVQMIGQEQVALPRLNGDKLWVHESPLEWLIHRRAGVVVVDFDVARSVLFSASPIAVRSRALKATLEEKWMPRIQVFDVGLAEAVLEGVAS